MKNYRISPNNIVKNSEDETLQQLLAKLNDHNPFQLHFCLLKYSNSLKKKLLATADFAGEQTNAFIAWSKLTDVIVGLDPASREIVVMAAFTNEYFLLTHYYGAQPNELFKYPFLDGYLSAWGYKDLQQIQTAHSMRGQGIGMWMLTVIYETVRYLTLVPANPAVEQFCVDKQMQQLPLKHQDHSVHGGPKKPMYTNAYTPIETFIQAPTIQEPPHVHELMLTDGYARSHKNTLPFAIKSFKPFETITFTGNEGTFTKTALLGCITIEKNKEPLISLFVEQFMYAYPLTDFTTNYLTCATQLLRFDEGMFAKYNLYNYLPNYRAYGFSRRINLNNFTTLTNKFR